MNMEHDIKELRSSFGIYSFLAIFLLIIAITSSFFYAFLAFVFDAMDGNYFYSDYVYFVCMIIFKCLCACVPNILAVVKFGKNKKLIDDFDYLCNNNSYDYDLKVSKSSVRTIKRIFVMSIVRMVFLVIYAIYSVIAMREDVIM